MSHKKLLPSLATLLVTPMILIVGMAVYGLAHFWNVPYVGTVALLISIAIGSFELIRDTIQSLLNKRFALDYIALVAIATGVVTGEFLVAAVICLMLAGGTALEEYAKRRAESALVSLISRIPDQIQLWEGHTFGATISIQEARVGQHIAVRKGEVVPLDGELISAENELDESSLTGEPYAVTKEEGDFVWSGTVNMGNVLVMKVTKTDADSAYKKIVALVSEAQKSKSPLIRLADRYSTWFTAITFILAVAAYLLSGDPERVLAVLVLATPCPLILATPIALMGGMNAAARKGIILKSLASLESFSRTQALIFDKTGTLTLGELSVTDVKSFDKKTSHTQILSLAASIERSSLHPIAKAIVKYARSQKTLLQAVHHVNEKIGSGIAAVIKDQKYVLKSSIGADGITIGLFHKNKRLGQIQLQDQLKKDSPRVLQTLHRLKLSLHLLSGDQENRVKDLVQSLDVPIEYVAEASPKAKMSYIKKLQNQGLVTAMIGDGINDAPALAAADTGIAFSNEEQSASSNAADIVLLNSGLTQVLSIFLISRRTIGIALQSIIVGIGLSCAGMVLASFGLIPPLAGALTQEVIDVLVILNALRASQSTT